MMNMICASIRKHFQKHAKKNCDVRIHVQQWNGAARKQKRTEYTSKVDFHELIEMCG